VLAEDLQRLGYDFNKMKADLGRDITAFDLAGLHLKHRVAGHNVRSAEQFLEEGAKRYHDWRAGRGPGGERTNATKAVADRINETRKLRGEVPVGVRLDSSLRIKSRTRPSICLPSIPL
jgi:hypothetical protein